jgi:hypothetical protein
MTRPTMTVCTVHVMSYTDSVNTSWHIQQGQCTEHDTLSKDSTHNKTHSSRTVHRAWHTPHGQHTLFKDSAQSMTHSPRTAHTTWHTLQGQWTEHDTLQGQHTQHDTLFKDSAQSMTHSKNSTQHDTLFKDSAQSMTHHSPWTDPITKIHKTGQCTKHGTPYKDNGYRAWHALQWQYLQTMTYPTAFYGAYREWYTPGNCEQVDSLYIAWHT